MLILTACSNNEDNNEQVGLNKNNNSEQMDYGEHFNDWLANHKLIRSDFADTSVITAFELWTYAESLTREDSFYLWYPSTDSSYFLLTNYDNKTNERKTFRTEDIDLRFLDNKNKNVYLGILLFDSLTERSIDYYWYDSITFYYIEKNRDTMDFRLTKLKMKADTIWEYRTIKNINNKNAPQQKNKLN